MTGKRKRNVLIAAILAVLAACSIATRTIRAPEIPGIGAEQARGGQGSSPSQIPAPPPISETTNDAADAAAFSTLFRRRAEHGDFGFNLPYTLDTANSPPPGDTGMVQLLRAWGRSDPKAALNALSALKTQGVDWETLTRYETTVLEGWVLAEPEKAWEWALNSIPAERAAAESSDPVRRIPLAPFAFERLTRVMSSLAEAGEFGTAAKLLDGSSDPFSWKAAAGVGERWGESDLDAAVEWINRIPFDTDLLGGASSGLARSLVRREAGDLFGVLARLRPEVAPVVAANGLNDFIERSDLPGAQKWLLGLSDRNQNGVLDLAVRKYFFFARSRQAFGRPEADGRLLAAIKDAGVQLEAARVYVALASRTDPQFAITAVSTYFPIAEREAAIDRILRPVNAK